MKQELKCKSCGKTLNHETAGSDKEKCNQCKMLNWAKRMKDKKPDLRIIK